MSVNNINMFNRFYQIPMVEQSAFELLLQGWQNAAPDEEVEARAIAAERILAVKNGQLHKLDLSGLGLTKLPNLIGTLFSLEWLDLSGNKLTTLPTTIENLLTLEFLFVLQNPLEDFPEWIDQMEARGVHIAHDVSPEVQEFAFECGLQRWQTAVPGEEGARAVAADRIRAVKQGQLTELILALGLSDLTPLIGKLLSLQKLVLSQNNLTVLPKTIGNLKNLGVLDLSNNRLERVPEEIGNLKNLRALDLSDNLLESLPKKIGMLHNLVYLDLSDNNLNHLPKEIGTLGSLKELNLSKNQLKGVPEEIGNLPKLAELNLLNNRLEALPASIVQMVESRRVQVAYDKEDGLAEIVDQINEYFQEEVIELIYIGEWLKSLSSEEQAYFIEFFNDFKSMQELQDSIEIDRNSMRMRPILEDLTSNSNFYNEVLSILDNRTPSCEDETALIFSSIEKAHYLHCQLSDADIEQVAQVLLGFQRVRLIEEKVVIRATKNGKPNESVESVLLALMILAPVLRLPVNIHSMYHREVALNNITEDQISNIGFEVLLETSTPDQQVELLMNEPLWKKRMKKAFALEIAKRQEAIAPCWEIYLDELLSPKEKIEQMMTTLTKIGLPIEPLILEKRQALEEMQGQGAEAALLEKMEGALLYELSLEVKKAIDVFIKEKTRSLVADGLQHSRLVQGGVESREEKEREEKE